MDWVLQQTATGATYLQVVILILFAVTVALPIAYITIRDWKRVLNSIKRSEHDVPRNQ